MSGILCLGKLPKQLTIISVLDFIKFSNWIFFKFLLYSLFFSFHFSLTAKKFFCNNSIFAVKLCIFNRFKITHQVRAEYWAKIMNECINSGMSKTAWCRANGISVKQFFYWQRILRREAFENSQNSLLPATAGPHQEMAPMVPATQRAVSFTEIKLPSSSQNTAPVFHPDLVIRKGSLILEISNSASDELLSRIGGLLGAE